MRFLSFSFIPLGTSDYSGKSTYTARLDIFRFYTIDWASSELRLNSSEHAFKSFILWSNYSKTDCKSTVFERKEVSFIFNTLGP